MRIARKHFIITEATKTLLITFELLVVGSMVFWAFRNYPHRTVDIINRNKFFLCWIIFIVVFINCIITGDNNRIILKISREGVICKLRGYYYEYCWEEIEFFYEKRRQFFVPMICFKAKNTGIPYEIDLDGIFWTLLPVRWAIKHFGGKSITYYTRHQWSKRQKDPSK